MSTISFDKFIDKESFHYELPKFAGKMPELRDGVGDIRNDFHMPRVKSTPSNIVMRDQLPGTRVASPFVGPGIPYPVIDTTPGFGKLSPLHWKPEDWREFFSPYVASWAFMSILGRPFQKIQTLFILIPFGTLAASHNINRRYRGEYFNREEFRKHVGIIPEVEEYYDRVLNFRKNSYYHNLFTWRNIEMQLGWDVAPPSWYSQSLSKKLNYYLGYGYDYDKDWSFTVPEDEGTSSKSDSDEKKEE